ncbi:ABC transporter ATP-binding protein [Paracoccus aminophilus]|uniref:Peptide/nickel transport system, ATP-binding protein n=1 Tax=Paracoccus aminophilus JCM 7686 TaxID=1367847 RepID=S5XUK6_PARAH|nr:ABC transporter ATP-binding protein [Paracoccus aminophilus]AGT08897.1 peptide/nickel transport system, ATP-binding protein [Paracoccus aminophilus JCM 7686]
MTSFATEIASLTVEGLSLHDLKGRQIVEDVAMAVAPGEVLAIIGESGSGKTSVALSLLGFSRPGMVISGGRVAVGGTDVLALDAAGLQRFRGNRITLVPQNPTTSFSPRMTIGRQMREVLIAHGRPAHEAEERIREVLAQVSLPNDAAFLKRYPFELSGGQLQRIAIGMAFMTAPEVIVMDEPTTGLDVSTQQTILELIRKLVAASRACFIYVTHDLAVVDAIADRVMVMLGGKVVEVGERRQIFEAPRHDYTRQLIATIPDLPELGAPVSAPATVAAVATETPTPVLKVADLRASHGGLEVVHGVSFEIARGACLALVGGSGSGKTTTGRAIAGLHAQASGELLFEGRPLATGLRNRVRQDLAALQIVFQNPDRSLNPRESVEVAMHRALRLRGDYQAALAQTEALALLDRVRLNRRALSLYPSDLSGGERQRVAIARALALNPRLLICDEITSALDVSVQASVIELLMELKADGLAMLFITHNLPLVAEIAEKILIMQQGNVVEQGPTQRVLSQPECGYTQELLSAAPRVRSRQAAADGAEASAISWREGRSDG